VKLPAHYGEVRDTLGADGDPVDVFVGDDPFAPWVYVVQAKLPGSQRFDETKAMLGFRTRDAALRAFRAAYNLPGFLQGVTRWPIGAWAAAMQRPKVHRGPMTAPLAKGEPMRLLMLTACPRPLAKGAGPKTRVKAYVRNGKLVQGHERATKPGAQKPANPFDQQPGESADEHRVRVTRLAATMPDERRDWVESLPHLPDETHKKYKRPDGTWEPERAKLHQKIIDSHFAGDIGRPRDGHAKTAVVMMGGTASGKSTCTKMRGIVNMVHCDADGVKEQLPEYVEAVKGSARNAAGMAHEESSELMKKVRDRAIAEGRNVLMDGTGSNGPKYRKFIDRLKAEGYHVTVMYVHCEQERALPRSRARAAREGRHVPEEFIEKAYSTIPYNFEHCAAGADDFHVFDTRTLPPRHVWSHEGGQETHHDPKFVQEYKAKFSGHPPKS
jgi:predicted ABC-type ATPase